MYNDYINVLYNTYCHHGGIDVVSSIVGGTASNVEVVGGVCNRLYSKTSNAIVHAITYVVFVRMR